MLKNFFGKTGLIILVLAVLIGFGAGSLYVFLTKGDDAEPFDTSKLTANLFYSPVEAGKMQCRVLANGAALYTMPSALDGVIIARLSHGEPVTYLATVPSRDKDERELVVTEEVKFRRFFGPTRVIPPGTYARLLRNDFGKGKTKVRVILEGKDFDVGINTVLLRFPHLGQWKKVEYNGKSGFMKYNELSDSKLE